ncbi:MULTISPECIES: ParA family protein [Fusobacterium]|uniref:ATPase n=1 Tax=Fusobacterium nucleatum subsp. polymorphum TaxID=76857 RepID=A0A2C5ZGC1_FUSNP|nr:MULTISPECIES: ParA family protein [Fusobacterium]PHH98449.1 ATPase [Fusobacterium polymorphum]QYR68804.1 ParA family protein [Fusobacterium animalis]
MGIILVKNNKGGVGKTYITLQLAAHKALIKNKKTLILTSDSQNDILKFAGIKVDDTSKFGLEDFIEGKSYKIKELRENLFFLHLQGYKIKNSFDEAFKKAIKVLKEEFEYIVIDGSPVMGLDNLFIEISDHIVIPTFLDNITTHSVLSMLKKVDLNKVKAVVPNRTGRTKLEKEYYDLLNKKLGVQGIYLSFPIPQISLISKLIDNETLLWESKSKKLDYVKGIFINIWKEIDNE